MTLNVCYVIKVFCIKFIQFFSHDYNLIGSCIVKKVIATIVKDKIINTWFRFILFFRLFIEAICYVQHGITGCNMMPYFRTTKSIY